jgi:hypothetical protein
MQNIPIIRRSLGHAGWFLIVKLTQKFRDGQRTVRSCNNSFNYRRRSVRWLNYFVHKAHLSPKQQLRLLINKAAYCSFTFSNQCRRVRGFHKGAAKNWGLIGCYSVLWFIVHTFRKFVVPWKDRECKTKRHCVKSQMTQMFKLVDSRPAAVQITIHLVKCVVKFFLSELCASFLFLACLDQIIYMHNKRFTTELLIYIYVHTFNFQNLDLYKFSARELSFWIFTDLSYYFLIRSNEIFGEQITCSF